jgi:hypothetical protein
MPLDVVYFAIVFVAMIVFVIIAEIKDLQNIDLKRELEYYKSTTKCFCNCEESHQCELKRLQAENEALVGYIEKLQGRDIDNGKAD